MTVLMTEMRNAMKEAMAQVVAKHKEDEILTADLLGAASWVMCDVMLMTDVDMDESVLKALFGTYHAVKLAEGLAKKESVH
jgi:hypothetical protein